jgi:hypothetical protein
VHSQLQKIYLHPKAAGTDKQSKFVDSMRFIPLEIKDGVELTAYNSVEVAGNYFLVKDNLGKAVMLYGRDGRFIKKISYKKLGKEFYPSYDEHNNRLVFLAVNKNYTLTSRDRLKISLDWNNPRNKKYYKKYVIDLKDTLFTIKKEIPQQNDILRAHYFYDDLYWQSQINTSELYKDSLGYELKIYKDNQLVKGFFPYNQVNETRFLYSEENVGMNPTDTPNVNFVTRPYCDTIYKMIGDSLFPAYQLVLPLENSLPSSFFTKPFKNKTDFENFRRNNGWMLRQIYSVYETPRFLYFSVGYFSNYEFYIYQKQNKVTYKAKNIKPDSSQYNIQVLSDYFSSRKEDRFYRPQKAGDLMAFFEKNKNVVVPKELEEFFKSNPPAATPVILEFKLKN